MSSGLRVLVVVCLLNPVAPANSTDGPRALTFRITADQMDKMHAKKKPAPAPAPTLALDFDSKMKAVSAALGLSDDDGRPPLSACHAARHHSADRTKATLASFDWRSWDWPDAPCGCGVLLNAASDPHYKTMETYFVYAALALSSRLRAASRGASTACKGGVRVALYSPKDAVEDLYKRGREKFLRDLAVVDVVRPYPPIKTYGTHAGGAKDSSVWQQRFRAKAASPFAYTLLLDTDAFPCAGYERLFDVLRHVDTASIKDYTLTRGYTDRPINASFERFPVRNLGTVLYRTEDAGVRAMIEEEGRVFDRMLRNRDAIWGDQDAFREALWRFAVARGVVRDKQIEDGSTICRHPPRGASCAQTSCLIRHHKEQEAFAAQLDRRLSCWAHCLGDTRVGRVAHESDSWFDTGACGEGGKLVRLAVCDWHTAEDIARLEAKSLQEEKNHVDWGKFEPRDAAT